MAAKSAFKHVGALSLLGVLIVGAIVLMLFSHKAANGTRSPSSSTDAPTATLAPTYITVNLPSPPTSTMPPTMPPLPKKGK